MEKSKNMLLRRFWLPKTTCLKKCTDWSLALPAGRLRVEHCCVAFANPIIGVLRAIGVEHSTVGGTPWCNATGLAEYADVRSEADRPRLTAAAEAAASDGDKNVALRQNTNIAV